MTRLGGEPRAQGYPMYDEDEKNVSQKPCAKDALNVVVWLWRAVGPFKVLLLTQWIEARGEVRLWFVSAFLEVVIPRLVMIGLELHSLGDFISWCHNTLRRGRRTEVSRFWSTDKSVSRVKAVPVLVYARG